ncbi:serine-rich adhesin for platelets-like isoform X2 [Ptychodera flava]
MARRQLEIEEMDRQAAEQLYQQLLEEERSVYERQKSQEDADAEYARHLQQKEQRKFERHQLKKRERELRREREQLERLMAEQDRGYGQKGGVYDEDDMTNAVAAMRVDKPRKSDYPPDQLPPEGYDEDFVQNNADKRLSDDIPGYEVGDEDVVDQETRQNRQLQDDEEFARLLEEQERKRKNKHKPKDISELTARDEEIARKMQQEEELMARRHQYKKHQKKVSGEIADLDPLVPLRADHPRQQSVPAKIKYGEGGITLTSYKQSRKRQSNTSGKPTNIITQSCSLAEPYEYTLSSSNCFPRPSHIPLNHSSLILTQQDFTSHQTVDSATKDADSALALSLDNTNTDPDLISNQPVDPKQDAKSHLDTNTQQSCSTDSEGLNLANVENSKSPVEPAKVLDTDTSVQTNFSSKVNSSEPSESDHKNSKNTEKIEDDNKSLHQPELNKILDSDSHTGETTLQNTIIEQKPTVVTPTKTKLEKSIEKSVSSGLSPQRKIVCISETDSSNKSPQKQSYGEFWICEEDEYVFKRTSSFTEKIKRVIKPVKRYSSNQNLRKCTETAVVVQSSRQFQMNASPKKGKLKEEISEEAVTIKLTDVSVSEDSTPVEGDTSALLTKEQVGIQSDVILCNKENSEQSESGSKISSSQIVPESDGDAVQKCGISGQVWEKSKLNPDDNSTTGDDKHIHSVGHVCINPSVCTACTSESGENRSMDSDKKDHQSKQTPVCVKASASEAKLKDSCDNAKVCTKSSDHRKLNIDYSVEGESEMNISSKRTAETDSISQAEGSPLQDDLQIERRNSATEPEKRNFILQIIPSHASSKESLCDSDNDGFLYSPLRESSDDLPSSSSSESVDQNSVLSDHCSFPEDSPDSSQSSKPCDHITGVLSQTDEESSDAIDVILTSVHNENSDIESSSTSEQDSFDNPSDLEKTAQSDRLEKSKQTTQLNEATNQTYVGDFEMFVKPTRRQLLTSSHAEEQNLSIGNSSCSSNSESSSAGTCKAEDQEHELCKDNAAIGQTEDQNRVRIGLPEDQEHEFSSSEDDIIATDAYCIDLSDCSSDESSSSEDFSVPAYQRTCVPVPLSQNCIMLTQEHFMQKKPGEQVVDNVEAADDQISQEGTSGHQVGETGDTDNSSSQQDLMSMSAEDIECSCSAAEIPGEQTVEYTTSTTVSSDCQQTTGTEPAVEDTAKISPLDTGQQTNRETGSAVTEKSKASSLTEGNDICNEVGHHGSNSKVKGKEYVSQEENLQSIATSACVAVSAKDKRTVTEEHPSKVSDHKQDDKDTKDGDVCKGQNQGQTDGNRRAPHSPERFSLPDPFSVQLNKDLNSPDFSTKPEGGEERFASSDEHCPDKGFRGRSNSTGFKPSVATSEYKPFAASKGSSASVSNVTSHKDNNSKVSGHLILQGTSRNNEKNDSEQSREKPATKRNKSVDWEAVEKPKDTQVETSTNCSEGKARSTGNLAKLTPVKENESLWLEPLGGNSHKTATTVNQSPNSVKLRQKSQSPRTRQWRHSYHGGSPPRFADPWVRRENLDTHNKNKVAVSKETSQTDLPANDGRTNIGVLRGAYKATPGGYRGEQRRPMSVAYPPRVSWATVADTLESDLPGFRKRLYSDSRIRNDRRTVEFRSFRSHRQDSYGDGHPNRTHGDSHKHHYRHDHRHSYQGNQHLASFRGSTHSSTTSHVTSSSPQHRQSLSKTSGDQGYSRASYHHGDSRSHHPTHSHPSFPSSQEEVTRDKRHSLPVGSQPPGAHNHHSSQSGHRSSSSSFTSPSQTIDIAATLDPTYRPDSSSGDVPSYQPPDVEGITLLKKTPLNESLPPAMVDEMDGYRKLRPIPMRDQYRGPDGKVTAKRKRRIRRDCLGN